MQHTYKMRDAVTLQVKSHAAQKQHIIKTIVTLCIKKVYCIYHPKWPAELLGTSPSPFLMMMTGSHVNKKEE
jgi:hypothetical protein